MKKLFVSFTSLLALVAEKKVSEQDLHDGLFFFGCWREFALDPAGVNILAEPAGKQGQFAAAQPVIAHAVRQAEAQGRVAWHNGPKKSSPWRELDDLLAENNFTGIGKQHEFGCHYSYPAVLDAIAEKG